MANVVEFIVRSKDESKAGTESASKNLRDIGDSADDADRRTSGMAAKVGKAAAAVGVAAATAAVGVGKVLYDIGSTFDNMSDTIRTGTGKTGDALNGLIADAKKVGTSVPSSFDDVGTAITAVSQRMDLTGKPLQDMTAQFLNLSRVTGTDVTSNIEQLTRVFGDWGIETQDQSKTLDQLFRASQQTGVGVDQLAQKVVQFGAPLRQMGFGFEESIALIGKFEKEGVNAELVLGSMRQALGRMAKAQQDSGKANVAAEKAQKALNDAIVEHGAGSIQARTAQEALTAAQKKGSLATGDAATVFRDYLEKIKEAGSVSEANGIALELFGARAGPDMAAAIREGRFSIDELVKSITNGTDTINKASLETMDFAEQWQLTKNRLMVAFEPAAAKVFGAIGEAMEKNGPKIAEFGESVGPLLVTAIETLIEVANTALPIISAVASVVTGLGPAAAPAIVAIGGITAAFKGVKAVTGVFDALPEKWASLATSAVANFGKMSAAALATMATHISSAVASAAAWAVANAAMLLGIGAIIIVIAALVAAVVLVVKHWDWIKEKTLMVWGIIQAAIQKAVDFIVGLFMNFTPVGLIIKHWETIKRLFDQGGQAIVNFIKRAVQLIVDIFMNFTPVGLIIKHWDTIKRVFSQGVDASVNFVRTLPGKLMGILSDLGNMLVGVGENIIDGIWRGIQKGWNYLVDKVRNLARSLLDAAKAAIGISSPSKAFEDEFGGEIPPGAARGVDKTAAIARRAAANMALGMLGQGGSSRGAGSMTPGGNQGAGMGFQGGGPIVLQFRSGGTPVEEFIAEILRNYVKVRGGDVQLVFGRE